MVDITIVANYFMELVNEFIGNNKSYTKHRIAGELEITHSRLYEYESAHTYLF